MRLSSLRVWVCVALVACSQQEAVSSETTPCANGSAQACACAGGSSGSQVCVSGGWTTCNCVGGSMAGTGAGGGLGGFSGGGAAGTGNVGTGDGGAGGVDASMPVGPGSVITEPQDDAAYLFDQSQLRTYELTIAPADLSAINADPSAEQYVPGALRFEGVDYPQAAVRYKGSLGAFYPPCAAGPLGGAKMGKCSIKVSFDEYDDAGRFFGVRKLNFHSMNGDDSMLRDRLGYAMFRESGIAAPRAAHVRLMINGQLEGLFVLVEQVDGRFTRARFTEGGEGNLYKEIWPMHSEPAAYLNALETNRSEQPTAARMLAFTNAIAQGATQAASFLDRDYMLGYLAVDRVIINDDGIMNWWCITAGQGNNPGGVGNHNYYWYEAGAVDRMWLVPWDLDNAFDGAPTVVNVQPEWSAASNGACTCGGGFFGAGSIAASCDPLVRHFISWLPDYERAVDAFIAGPFAASNVDAKLNAWTAQIDAAVQETAGLHGAPSYPAWQSEVQSLRSRIASARGNRGRAY